MNIHQANRIHLIGIKGVGMAALACCLKDLDKNLSGSDSADPQITDDLIKSLDVIVKPFSSANLTPDIDLVIYSGAYKKTFHPELLEAIKLGLPILTLAEAQAQLSAGKLVIAVCGVGGKTTTTSMLIDIFSKADRRPSWSVGVSRINGQLPPGRVGEGEEFIIEADEYAVSPPDDLRPKFSLLDPSIIICTNLVYDHPDIYADFSATKTAFLNFFLKLADKKGLLIYHGDDQNLVDLVGQLPSSIQKTSFGTAPNVDYHLDYQPGANTISLKSHISFSIALPGLHNAKNALAAYIVSEHLGLPQDKTITSLKAFSGTKRRLEKIADSDNILYYDDYAHHPAEIRSTLTALKTFYPTRRLIVIFQPHTYSRTKALFDDFSVSFDQADQVVIAPIFASARETADPSISGEKLAAAISQHQSNVIYQTSLPDIVKYLTLIQKPGDLILTMGAGDVYKIHQMINPGQ